MNRIFRTWLSAQRTKKKKKTHITLIHKKKNFEKINDFKPINLCNVSYKFISKPLANRLRMVLPN